MGIATIIVLILITIGLFWAARTGKVLSKTLELSANIAGIIAMLAAILLFVIPAATPNNTNATPTIAPPSISNKTSVPLTNLQPVSLEDAPTEGSAITATSIPTEKPSPSVVETAKPAPPTDTPTPSVPTVTERPTNTPLPPTTVSNTDSRTLLEPGQAWIQNDVELILSDYGFKKRYMFTSWIFTNNTNKPISVKFLKSNVVAKDNNGQSLNVTTFQDYPGDMFVCDGDEMIVNPGESVNNLYCKNPLWIQMDTSNSQIKEVTITVFKVARIERAQWKLPVYLH